MQRIKSMARSSSTPVLSSFRSLQGNVSSHSLQGGERLQEGERNEGGAVAKDEGVTAGGDDGARKGRAWVYRGSDFVFTDDEAVGFGRTALCSTPPPTVGPTEGAGVAGAGGWVAQAQQELPRYVKKTELSLASSARRRAWHVTRAVSALIPGRKTDGVSRTLEENKKIAAALQIEAKVCVCAGARGRERASEREREREGEGECVALSVCLSLSLSP